MGVKNLWQILGPYGHKISVAELQKKQVAVDLSCWICESQVLTERNKSHFPKLHLRNIFFRTAVLLSADVIPIFIMDGDPPKVKLSTLTKRNQLRAFNKNQAEEKENHHDHHEKKVKRERKMLKYTLQECQGLLKFLGLECLWSCGEGEALCALLDQKGIVDGIITQDNDAFLYGARKVYRNFTISSGFGTVDVFKMSDVEKHLNLTKEKLIAMSLLCGCDYSNTGIYGIGTGKSLKYLSGFNGDVLTRLKQLKYDKELTHYDAEKNGCKKCRHPGKLNVHMKCGCTICGTEYKCIGNNICRFGGLSVDEKMKLDFELEIRQRTATDPEFPDMSAVNEYLKFSQKVPDIKAKWMEPDISGFILFMREKCNWSPCYAFQKIAPLYCRWSLLNEMFKDFIPCRLLKKRVFKGVPGFDVEWIMRGKLYKKCKDHDNCVDEVITTIEPEVLIMEKCKDLYESFMAERYEKSKKGNKRPKKKTKKEQDVGDLIDNINRLSIGNKSAESNNFKSQFKSFSKNDQAESVNVSMIVCDVNESGEFGESDFNLDFNDSSTVDYDLNDYRLNESSILNSIIARREYY